MSSPSAWMAWKDPGRGGREEGRKSKNETKRGKEGREARVYSSVAVIKH